MKSLILGLVLIALPAFGDDPAVSIRLYFDFQQAAPENVASSIRDELARIMSPMGMAFDWKPLAQNRGNQLSVKLAVLHFTGSCEVPNAATPDLRTGALGWTHMTNGVILPFGEIDCGVIGAFLRADLLARPEEEQEEDFGRAVGRVLAHELYHIFINTAHHSSHGVGKPYYSVQELLSKSFQFEPKETEELRKYWSDLVTGGF